jgi:ADP-heptose:LPS heptosyltransferase
MRKILVLCRHALGDIVLARPVFENLRAWMPDACIVGAAYPEQAKWLVLHPEIDETIFVPHKGPGVSEKRDWLAWIRAFTPNPPVLTYDMLQTDRSSFATFLTRAERRVGFAQNSASLRHRVYTHLWLWREPRLGVTHSRDLYLEPLGGGGVPIETRRVQIPLERHELDTARARIRAAMPVRGAPLVVLHPGASTANKLWPVDDFAAVCDFVQESGLGQFLFLGGGARETERLAAIQRRMRTPVSVFTEALQIRELAAVLHEADLFVGHDSGPMHLAAAVGTRCVALFGGSEPAQWGPLGEGHSVLRAEQPCDPCPFPEICQPPNPYHVFCVRRVQQVEVRDAIVRQLEAVSGKQRSGMVIQ